MTVVEHEQIAEYQPHPLSEHAASAMQLLLDLEAAGLVTPRSLALPDGIEYGTAEALGVFITEVVTRGNFYLGDWMIEVEAKLPEQFSQLAEATGRSEPTRLHLMSVCRNVPKNRRREALLWGHHVAVYKLGAREQKQWLAKAERDGWTAAELRRQMKADRTDARPALPGTEPGEVDTGMLTEAALSLVNHAELAGENAICRREDFARLRAALGLDE